MDESLAELERLIVILAAVFSSNGLPNVVLNNDEKSL